jgi:hypothetical protein
MTTETENKKPTLAETCVEQAQKLFEQAERLGKRGGSFAIAGADLLATAGRSERVQQAKDFFATLLPLAALFYKPKISQLETEREIEPTPYELREKEIAALGIMATHATEAGKPDEAQSHRDRQSKLIAERDAENLQRQTEWFVQSVITGAAKRLEHALADELHDLVRENKTGALDEEIERLLCEVAPIRFGRLMKAAAAVENRNFTGIEGDDQ